MKSAMVAGALFILSGYALGTGYEASAVMLALIGGGIIIQLDRRR